MMRGRRLIEGIFFVLSAVLCGCPDVATPPISAVCAKSGEKCKTEKGPLGVCDTITCAQDETAPCFRCMPQH